MQKRYWNPGDGQAYQGDIVIMKIDDYPCTTQRITTAADRIVLAEGELTGHHHSVPLFRDDALARCEPSVGTAALYRDDDMARRLGLDRQLAVGFLVVEGGPVEITHQEHATIVVPPGVYYVGRQREWTAGEVRRVED